MFLRTLLSGDGLMTLVYRIPAILIALAFHEWAHAFVAYRRGDPTARNLGRMTINPLSHIDPVGTLMLLFVGFGWAKPVPINTRNFKHPKMDEIFVSLAGVVTNLILAFLFMGVWFAVLFYTRIENEVIVGFINAFWQINVGLAVFNLLPIAPLDGSHVLMCLIPRRFVVRVHYYMSRYGYYVLIGLLLLGVIDVIIGAVANWIIGGMQSFYILLFGLF